VSAPDGFNLRQNSQYARPILLAEEVHPQLLWSRGLISGIDSKRDASAVGRAGSGKREAAADWRDWTGPLPNLDSKSEKVKSRGLKPFQFAYKVFPFRRLAPTKGLDARSWLLGGITFCLSLGLTRVQWTCLVLRESVDHAVLGDIAAAFSTVVRSSLLYVTTSSRWQARAGTWV
jgi:hypothetical protein